MPSTCQFAIDVGNTHWDVGLADATTIVHRWRWPTRPDADAEGLARDWRHHLPEWPIGDRPAVASCVVPALRAALRHWWPGLDLVTPSDTAWGFHLDVPDPRQIGTDRLAACAGALALVGEPVIVVDSGTAATLSVIDGHRRFVGGAILPGLHSGLQGLVRAAPRLPQPDLSLPVDALGRTTEDALRLGTVRGHAGALQALIAAARTAVGPAAVIGTGGSMPLVASWVPEIDRVVPDLVLRGLLAIGHRSHRHG